MNVMQRVEAAAGVLRMRPGRGRVDAPDADSQLGHRQQKCAIECQVRLEGRKAEKALPEPISEVPIPQPAAMRTASQTRVLALALQRAPLVTYTKVALERRWRVGPDTVRTVLRDCNVDPGPDRSLAIPLTDALLCEGIGDPLGVWVSASPDYRKILSADLLTLEDWLAQSPEKARRDRSKTYRQLSHGGLSSIRIGKQHRFRPALARALHSAADVQGARP